MNDAEMVRSATVGRLLLEVYRERAAMGRAAAAAVARRVRDALARQDGVRIIFASAPSQVEFLDSLAGTPDLDWSRVTAFHMDEYIGVPMEAPQSFGRFLRTRLFDRVGVGQSHFIDGAAPLADECVRYASLVRTAPIDIVCLGIGENGHIAFNDPPVADFADPLWVKAVELDERSRRQQVNDGCFPRLDEVPHKAITLTIPALMDGRSLYVVVPGPSKADAVHATVTGAIDTSCPATILRTHPHATMFLDPDSARLVTMPVGG